MNQNSASQKSPSQWLIGTWRSNKAKTLAHYNWPRKDTARLKKLLSRILGKLTCRYTPSRVHTEFEGDKTSASYRVVWEGKDELFLVTGPRGREEGQHIWFTSPVEFHVRMARGDDEFFEKVQSRT